jgi:hypothetical protein
MNDRGIFVGPNERLGTFFGLLRTVSELSAENFARQNHSPTCITPGFPFGEPWNPARH